MAWLGVSCAGEVCAEPVVPWLLFGDSGRERGFVKNRAGARAGQRQKSTMLVLNSFVNFGEVLEARYRAPPLTTPGVSNTKLSVSKANQGVSNTNPEESNTPPSAQAIPPRCITQTNTSRFWENQAKTSRPAKLSFWFQTKTGSQNLPTQAKREQLVRSNAKQFQGGLVFKARRLLYHSTLGRE